MEKQEIKVSLHLSEDLTASIHSQPYDKLFVLTDSHTESSSLPLLRQALGGLPHTHISIPAGDTHKDVASLCHVWEALSRGGASRHSLLLNLGGGMTTDLGGFAAATFKRGIRYINLPTTLLSMVDAAVGGKTGINFGGLKNEVGVFRPAAAVLIHTPFLSTLDRENLVSGYAEMLKHGLISTPQHWAELLRFPLQDPDAHLAPLSELVGRSVQVKEGIVAQDPYEQGLRKALNLGHTVGHAFESLSFQTGHPVLHGYAVAWGLICELYLSATLAGFPTDALHQTVRFIRDHWGYFPIDCEQYETLYELMTHDKKNMGGVINFTLLREVGDIALNQTATRSQIYEALDFYRDGAH